MQFTIKLRVRFIQIIGHTLHREAAKKTGIA